MCPAFFPFQLPNSNMSTVRRSSRLMANHTETVDSKQTLHISGSTPSFKEAPTVIQGLTFSFYWREKDYGDAVMEDWYFTVRAAINMPTGYAPSFSFWRNYVYFAPTRISFGHLNSCLHICKRGETAILQRHGLGAVTEYTLADTFETVATKLKAVLKNLDTEVQGHAVYYFPLNIPDDVHPDDYHSPPILVSFL